MSAFFFTNHSFSSDEKSYVFKSQKHLVQKTEHLNVAKTDYVSLLGEKLKEFKSKINRKAKINDFHGVVLVAYKNQIIFNKAFGYKNPIDKTELSIHDAFELASVSKQFTAASILKLVELGKIDLEKPFKTYFPNFKFENIRVKDLLKHSSGLWDYMNLTEAYWNKSKAPDNFEIIELLNNHQTTLNFKPGRKFDYNNTNYVLLVTLIEKISGKSFKDFLKDQFFQPLGLNDIYVGINSRAKIKVANAYQAYGRGYIKLPPSYHNSALGDKGIHTTASDLWLWFNALKNRKSISQASINKMFNLNNYTNYNYGMGFRTQVGRFGELEIYHDGLWDGFRNGLHYFPKDDLTYIVLSHTQNREKVYFQNYLERHAKVLLNQLNKKDFNNSVSNL
ncbi:serine hydrolase domain-containing protein [Mesohalobacter salilacus]|uniref:serine hydrolase domain-containing protein n=1 Tax=Mesohalobacter salilacus TaxID=2491711 RepID=UPI00403E764E